MVTLGNGTVNNGRRKKIRVLTRVLATRWSMMANANRRFFSEGQMPTSTMVIPGVGTDKDGNSWLTSDRRHETGTPWPITTTVNKRFCLAALTWRWALRVRPLAIHGNGTEDHGSSDRTWVRLRGTALS